MRERQPFMVLTFAATTDALAFEAWCHANNLPGRLIPLPSQFSAGCGLAWRMTPAEWLLHADSLRAVRMPFTEAGEILAYG